jgi:hypothetical protein
MLREASGGQFDSWHQQAAGSARVYWVGAPPTASVVARLAAVLETYETDLRVVTPELPEVPDGNPTWLLDPAGELSQAFDATGPLAVVVDASGRVAERLTAPTADVVESVAQRLYDGSTPDVVRAQAPVLLLERVLEPTLCRALMDHWRRSDKLADGVASALSANLANADVKRRQDVPLDDVQLYMQLEGCLVRRVMPAVLQAFQTRIVQIEAPRIGCYNASSGGWFRHHRDNMTEYTAHRQFALSLNLNGTDAYEGGEIRFPEFGRQLYRPTVGGGLVCAVA